MSEPQSILVIRLSAIGDVIMATPLIPALREAYPRSRLVWLTEETQADLLLNNPRLDKVLVWPRRRWRKLWQERHYLQWFREFFALARALRQEKFDLVLDAQGLWKSAVWALLSGCKRRIGLASKEGSQYVMQQVISRDGGTDEDLRISSEYLRLVRALGIEPTGFAMDLVASEAEKSQAQAWLQEKGINGGFAVICPFTTRPQKHWYNERWAELAEKLKAQTGLTVLMLGGPGDGEGAAQIAGLAPSVCNGVGQTRLGQCIALIEQAKLLIGVDTGLTHLGIAMNTPTLAVFGSTKPYLDTAVAHTQVLYQALPCAPCERHPTCGGEFTCMKQYSAQQLLDRAISLLELARRNTA